MTTPSFLDVSELSFDGLKNNLKTFLQAQPQFTDYNFEGSNLNALLDILSYNSYMNAYYLNMVGSEMFLDSAQVKSSVVSHAKELNYVPRSATSAKAQVVFTIGAPQIGGPQTLVIPKYYSSRAVVNNTLLDFTTAEDVVVFESAEGYYVSQPTYIYEGKIVNEIFTAGETSGYVLKSETVDINSIVVNVSNSSTDFANVDYTFADSLYGLNSNSNAYFIQGYGSNQYEILFGDGVFGKPLSNGNIVKVTYRSTHGELGNLVTSFSPTNTIQPGGYTISVATVSPASQGSSAEGIESIRFYAPRHFTTQNRAVTTEDFVTLVQDNYPEILTMIAYGGEDAVPPEYGKVVLSMIMGGTNPIVPDDIKADIIKYLSSKTITVQATIKDPVIIYVQVNCEINYDPSATTNNQGQIQSEVLNQIEKFSADHLSSFGDSLRLSKLSSYIDQSDSAIISNQTSVKAIYKIAPVKDLSTIYNFTFGNPIDRTIKFAYNPGEAEAIKSTTFTYTDSNNNFYNNAVISDDGLGNLRIYYSTIYNPVVILQSNIGTVNYTTGELNFTINVWDYTTNTIDIYARLLNSDITVSTNKYLTIDFSKTNILVNPI